MTRMRWNYAIINWYECYNHRSCIKNFGEDCSCHHCQISRRLPKEHAPSHKQWPPRPCLSSLRPKKHLTFCWWNVQMQSIQWWCCILTKFMFAIKSTCDFFSSTDMFYPGNTFICAGATLTQTWLSISNLCQIKRLPHKNHRLDFHTIYNKWLPAYNLYTHQNLCRLNECM